VPLKEVSLLGTPRRVAVAITVMATPALMCVGATLEGDVQIGQGVILHPHCHISGACIYMCMSMCVFVFVYVYVYVCVCVRVCVRVVNTANQTAQPGAAVVIGARTIVEELVVIKSTHGTVSIGEQCLLQVGCR